MAVQSRLDCEVPSAFFGLLASWLWGSRSATVSTGPWATDICMTLTDSRRDKNPNQYQGWSHRETIGTACHGSARASSSNWTFPLCRCRTAIIKGGTTLTSGFTVAPASRINWTRCELPSSTASSNIVVGCCFGGRMLGSARACKSRCVRLTPGRGNRKSLEAWYAYASVSLSRKIASASKVLVCPPSGVSHVRSRPWPKRWHSSTMSFSYNAVTNDW